MGVEGMDELLTEEWLKEVGFRWHRLQRQPDKHWLLWLGDAVRDGRSFTDREDLGVVVAPGVSNGRWFCWLRADLSSLFSRFIHIRHIQTRGELVRLIEGITGREWNPANNMYGAMLKPERAAQCREDDERLDRKILKERPWRQIEKDDARGGALPEHMQEREELLTGKVGDL